MFIKNAILGFVLGFMAVSPAIAQDENIQSDAISTNYVGDQMRIGIGYNSDTKLTGEFFWAFDETTSSAWIAEGWLGDESAGGLKLNYHWLKDGVEAGLDENGSPVYSDGKVRKFFLAADRNQFDDAKVSLGFGSERENRFWSLYGSKSTTGERFLGQNIFSQDQLVTGIINNHAFARVDTLQTITDFFAHPYDWGVGFRVGRYFEDSLVRLRGGLDYESGDFSSSQLTAFAGVDKRFADSAHGISLRAEVLRKDGDFEIDDSDFRVTAFWTWEFGSAFHPATVYRDARVERTIMPAIAASEEVVEVVDNRVTLSSTASFELDSARLSADALKSLAEVVESLESAKVVGDILVIGHTCYLGSDEYNQGLSERRAKAVFDQLTSQGINAADLKWEGRGEKEPRFSNDTEETRQHNRRVEITFTAEEEIVTTVTIGPKEAVTEWVQEKVPVEAAWIRRALRNPVQHKRSVDFYRINRVSENLITGVAVLENTGPAATDDMYSIDRDSGATSLNVLVNDSDPEGDTLTIVSVTTPSNGTAVISGNSIDYTPDSGYTGSDSFSYTVEDGFGGMATANVTITIQPPNDPPVAVDDQYTVPNGSNSNVLDVLVNDSDPDGDSISIVSVTTPGYGTASISGDQLLYTPNPGYAGTDSFQYTIEDTIGEQATATVMITVDEVNLPPIAVDDYFEMKKDGSAVLDVLANDSDPNGDPLTIVEIIQSDHPMGTVTINGDGTVTYTPMFNWWGGDTFQYTISDGRGGMATATVVIEVTLL